MTDENNKLRALILTALMVFSVFAGTVALSGSVAAAANDDISSADVTGPSDKTYNLSTVSEGDIVSHQVQFSLTIAEDTPYNNVTIDISETAAAGFAVDSVSASSANGDTDVSASQDGTDIVLTAEDTNNGTAGDKSGLVTVNFDLEVTADAAADSRIRHNFEDQFGNTATASFKTYNPGSTIVNTNGDTISPDADVFAGETVTVDTDDTIDQKVEVYRLDSDSNRVQRVENLNTQPGDTVNFDTSGLQSGSTYEVVVAGSSVTNFTVFDLGLTAEASDSSIQSNEDLTVDVTSNDPGGAYVAYLYDSSDNEVTNVSDSFDGSGDATVNFGQQSAGNYTVEVVHTASGVSNTTDTITVDDTAATSATFVTQAVSDERGDIVAMNVSITGAGDSAQVTFGGPSVNYQESVTVTDGNDDGYVTVYWNTYLAGTNDANTFSVASDDDSVDDTTLSSAFTGPNAGPGTLSGGEYPVNASAGGSETGVATVVLNNPNDVQRSINVWTAPTGQESVDSSSSTYVVDAITQDDSIAMQDELVLEVTAAGIYGQLGTAGPAVASGSDFKGITGADLTIMQTNPGTNLAPTMINASNRSVIVTPSSNSWLLYADTEDGNFSAGENYQANVSFSPDWAYGTKQTQSVTASFSVVERSSAIDAPQDTTENPLIVEQSSEAEISGTSSLAAGTNLTVTARSQGGQNPFLRSTTATVQDDGTWTTSIDVSDIPTGTNFTVSVKDSAQSNAGETVNARIGGAANIQLASLDAPETAAPGETITVTATVENTGDSSGETQVSFVFENETLLTQNVTVDAGSTTQVTFEPTLPSETGDYTHGVQVGDNDVVTAGITVQEDTSTTTEPTTTEPTDEPTTTEPTDEPTTTEPTDAPTTAEPTDAPTTTEESGGQPGFGVAVALVALLAAALLATRRDN